MKKYYIAIVCLFLLSALAIGWNITVMKDPASDNQRVNDLSTIETAVERYASKNNKLPASLSAVELTGAVKGRASEYEYKMASGGKYQLCATFKTDTTKQASAFSSADSTDPTVHAKGHACFDYVSYGVSSYAPAATASAGTDDTGSSVCTTTLPATSSMDSGTISKLDVKTGSLTIGAGTYTWKTAAAPMVYDTDCKAISLATLKMDDDIDVYYSSSKTVLAIQVY